MTDKTQKQVDAYIGMCRILGPVVTVIGCILTFVYALALVDPAASIDFFGVSTQSFSLKVLATLFTALFPVIGLLMSFAPEKLLNKWIAKRVTTR